MLHKLSDDFLIKSYIRAISLDLDQYFIFLIEQELSKRGLISIQSQCSHSTAKAVKVYADSYRDRW